MSMIINKQSKCVETQSHRAPGENWMGNGWISVPEALEKAVMQTAPYCDLTIEAGEDGSEALVGITPTQKPIAPLREAKLAELSAACNTAIVAGVDLELSGETVHFDLSIEEQSNIANLFRVVELGGTQYPYQADGGVCRIYSAAEITQIYIATQTLITTQRTYLNALKEYVKTLTSAEELEPIVYGMELPDAYATQMADKLAVAQAQMDAIVARLGG